MSDIKLSICIPTYNRENFLRNALSYCLRDFNFDFSYEIVICDNASTDGTGEVAAEFKEKGLPIHYFRRTENGGSGPNLVSAFHHARGEYIVYLADDDILIASQLSEIVAYLNANPDVGACHAPWILHNEVEGQDDGAFYHLDQDIKFNRGDFAGAFDLMYQRHIFPEIAVYRASMLYSAWVPRNYCFWAFSYLANFLAQGAVTFMKKPFYRSVTISKVANRTQTGHEDVMTSWDKYRGGLEYFLYMGVKRGNIPNNQEKLRSYEDRCRVFTLNRMAVAIRFWIAKNDFITAYELYTRMAIGGLGHHPDVARIADSLPLLVAVQTFVWHVNSTADIDRVILKGDASSGAIETLLRDLKLHEHIAVGVDTGTHDPALVERTAVLFSNEEERQDYLALGYKPGLLFTDNDLMRHTVM